MKSINQLSKEDKELIENLVQHLIMLGGKQLDMFKQELKITYEHYHIDNNQELTEEQIEEHIEQLNKVFG